MLERIFITSIFIIIVSNNALESKLSVSFNNIFCFLFIFLYLKLFQPWLFSDVIFLVNQPLTLEYLWLGWMICLVYLDSVFAGCLFLTDGMCSLNRLWTIFLPILIIFNSHNMIVSYTPVPSNLLLWSLFLFVLMKLCRLLVVLWAIL